MQNYIKYDAFGVKLIRCMNCGLPIVIRRYVKIKNPNIKLKDKRVMVMTKLSSFRQKTINLEDGAYMEAMVCDECVNLDIDMDEMEQTVRNGWELTLTQEGKSKAEIKNFINKLPKIKR